MQWPPCAGSSRAARRGSRGLPVHRRTRASLVGGRASLPQDQASSVGVHCTADAACKGASAAALTKPGNGWEKKKQSSISLVGLPHTTKQALKRAPLHQYPRAHFPMSAEDLVPMLRYCSMVVQYHFIHNKSHTHSM